MQVFVDESGCTGFKFGAGSTNFFALAAVLFRTEADAEEARRGMAAVRSQLGWPEHREFKFNKCDEASRFVFLRALRGMNFTYYAFVLNKPALAETALRKRHQVYTKTVQWVFENAIHELQDATVVFDARCEHRFYQYLEAYLKRMVRARQRDGAIAAVRAQDSRSDDLLQVADMVAGSLARYYSDRPDSRYYISPIKKRGASVRFWPPKTT